MKKAIPLALAALFTAAGCATPSSGVANGGKTAATGATTQYCWKDRLSTEGDNLVCNWAASADEACKYTEFGRTLKKSQVASGPANSRRCSNGQWLVEVTTR